MERVSKVRQGDFRIMSKNRFAGLQAVKKINDSREVKDKSSEESEKPKKMLPPVLNQKAAKNVTNTNNIESEFILRRGRPKGKRSDKAFQQVTAYVRRATYKKVLIKLLEREEKKEYSELVEELMQNWLKDQL